MAAVAATNPPAVRQKNTKRFMIPNACKNIWLLEDAGFFFLSRSFCMSRIHLFCATLPPVTGRPTADATAQFFQLPSELTCPTILR
ncbi:MAG: hypothetical protein ACK559_30055, partial [bacterium]